MSEKSCNNNSDNALTSRRTDGGKNNDSKMNNILTDLCGERASVCSEVASHKCAFWSNEKKPDVYDIKEAFFPLLPLDMATTIFFKFYTSISIRNIYLSLIHI